MSRRELTVVPGVGNPQWYSGAATFGDLVWTAGQVPARADGSMPEEFAEQVTITLDNLEKTLQHVGASLGTLLKINTYLASLDDFEAYNEIYVDRLAAHGLPPRTTVEVARFIPPMKIEIEAVAHVLPAA
jgi:2-iminobutanoate/2-iminopropanoate deaminase